MNIQSHPSILPLLFGGVLLWANAGYLLWRWKTGNRAPGQLLAAGLVASFAASITSFAGEQAYTTLGPKVFWNQMQYLGDAPHPAFLLAFVLVYVGYDLSKRHYAVLFALPLLTLVAVFTNPLHRLFWPTVSLGEVGGYVILSNGSGVLYWLFVVYAYVFSIIALLLLAQAAVNATALRRRHLTALAVGSLLPGLAGIAYILQLGPVPTPNYTGYAYIGTAGAYTYAVYRHDMFTVVPIARRTAFEQMDEGIVILDSRGRVASANAIARRYLDRVQERLAGEPGVDVLGQLVTGLDLDSTDHQETTVETGAQVFEVTLRPLTRSDVVVGRLITIDDQTLRYRRERQLEELNTRFTLALEGTNTGVWEWDIESDELIWDDASKRLFGYDAVDSVTYDDFAARLLPEDFTAVEAAMDRAIETGEEYQSEYRIQHPDGTRRWIQARGVVEYDDNGTHGRLHGIQTDVTDRKEYEEKLEETNRRLEVLNRIVRHDIGNDMTVVIGLAEYLATELDDEMAQKYLQKIITRGIHVAEITDTMRDLMETMLKESDTLERTNLDTILAREIESIRSMDDAVIVRGPADPLGEPVLADSALGAVFRNLLTNAVRHNDKDRPEISVSISDSGDKVHVRIEDNGPGIPEMRRKEIFGRGEKGLESPGSGMGLYLVDTLVVGYGGDVHIEESEDGGAAFVVALRKATADV